MNKKYLTIGINQKLLRKYSKNSDQDLDAYYGLPKQVIFCKKCVISNQRPCSTVEFKSNISKKKETIEFDNDGICSACQYAEIKEKKIDWKDREKKLLDLCKYYRSKKGDYDCIVPGSGGKDSSFTAHILKYKYKMNPLTVTWAPHIYTEIGFQNFQKWIHSGFDNVLFTPNGKIHRLLTKLAFVNLLHPFQPFIIGQRHIAPRISTLYGIPLIFYGENQAEYGNNIEDNFKPIMDSRFFADDINLNQFFLGGVSANKLLRNYNLNYNDLLPYFPIDKEEINKTGTTVYYLGYYLKWDPQECFYYASQHTGFSTNSERTEGSYSKYSSIDDRIDPLHYYTTFIKFCIGRATYDASQEIRNNKITREEGITLVRRFDSEFPQKYFRQILEYMDLSEKEFWWSINKFRSPHLWRLNKNKWELRHTVWK